MTPIIKIKSAIQTAFSNIGKKNGTSAPTSKVNTFSIAYEFFCAEIMRSAANKRHEEAKKAAFDAGLLGEPSKYVEGETITTHDNEHFTITAKKAAASSTLDRTMLSNALSKRYGKKLDATLCNEILAEASKPRAGAVTISCAMKVEG